MWILVDGVLVASASDSLTEDASQLPRFSGHGVKFVLWAGARAAEGPTSFVAGQEIELAISESFSVDRLQDQ